MALDRSNFLLIAGALAAGGVGGWALRERQPKASLPPAPAAAPAPPTSATPEAAPIAVTVSEASAANGAATSTCDDSLGAAEECPSVGPADEGICANVIFKRCGDFKAALKPRVAAQAVACLRALKGNDRCDPARINQCGHAALMSACPEPGPAWKGELKPASGTQPAVVAIAPDTSSAVLPVALACDSIVKSCGSGPLSPTRVDCLQTLAGMTETGRASMLDCVSAHCTDRGLYGCEAVPKPVSASTGNNR